MKLKEERIKELAQIIKEDYGIGVTHEKVGQIASGLTDYFDLLAKIHHQDVEGPEALAL